MPVKSARRSTTRIAKAPRLLAALATFPISASIERNVRHVEQLTRQAAERKARLIVFPEGAVSGYYGEHFFRRDEVDAGELSGAHRRMGQLARENQLYLAAGTLFCDANKGRYSNSLAVWNPEGRRVARYDKRHRTGRDCRFYEPGHAPVLVTVDGIRVGLLICFDVRFPLWAHEYARRGAEVLVYVFNACDSRGLWKRPAMEAHLRSRAAENNVFVLSVNDARPHPNVPTLAVDRGGCTIVSGYPCRPSLQIAELDMSATYAIEDEIVAGHALDYPFCAKWKPARAKKPRQ